MIVISAGLQKSGSGLFFNLTNDLMVASGHQDVRELKSTYHLEELLKYHNCNIGSLEKTNLKKLIPLHNDGHSFVVKTHEGPTPYLQKLSNKNMIKCTCIFRDPRDIVLSAMDHGRKIREGGENHTFASCLTIKDTLPQVKRWMDHGVMKWMGLEEILLIRYEELLENPLDQMKKLCQFLRIQASPVTLEKIWLTYQKGEIDNFQKDFLHFNIGRSFRYREILTPEELDECNKALLPYLTRMGYSL